MDSKKNIFIRAMPGASMHFLGLVVWALATKEIIPLLTPYKAEAEASKINQYHNWNNFWLPGPLQDEYRARFVRCEKADCNDNAEWLKQQVKFHSTPHDVYVIFIHSLSHRYFLEAFPNSLLINIVHDNDDVDQISWNWAMKTGSRATRPDYEQRLLKINKNLNKLKHITYNSIPIGDCKFFTYFQKFGMGNLFDLYNEHNRTTDWDTSISFNINFKDIMWGGLKQVLPQLCEFLNVTPGEEFLQQLNVVIDNYVKAQIRVPWILTLDDYQ